MQRKCRSYYQMVQKKENYVEMAFCANLQCCLPDWGQRCFWNSGWVYGRGELKGQRYTTFIIVWVKVIINWYVKFVNVCYFFKGKASHRVSSRCVHCQPFVSFCLQNRTGRECESLAAPAHWKSCHSTVINNFRKHVQIVRNTLQINANVSYNWIGFNFKSWRYQNLLPCFVSKGTTISDAPALVKELC